MNLKTVKNKRFTSYDRSTVTSLGYAVNRSYSSGQGRFTTVDPIGFSATSLGIPQSLNLYGYTENNPIDFVDPTGLLLYQGRNGSCFIDYDETTGTTRTVCFTDNWSTPDPGTGGDIGGVGSSPPAKKPKNCSIRMVWKSGQKLNELTDPMPPENETGPKDTLKSSGMTKGAGYAFQGEATVSSNPFDYTVVQSIQFTLLTLNASGAVIDKDGGYKSDDGPKEEYV